MTGKTGVERVTSVITDIMPKVEKAADEISAMGNAVGLRAINTLHRIGGQFREMDDAVTKLEALLAQATNGPPPANMEGEVNPNGPLPDLGPRLVK